MEVALVEAVFIDLHPLLHVGLHLKSFVDDEGTARLDECGVVAETFQIGLFGAVDVEMVGVGAGDDRHPGAQPVERTVEFIGLNHHVVALFGEDIVGAVVLGDTSEEGITVDAALVHDVGAHGGSGGLAVSACHAKSFVRAGEDAQHLGALLNFEAVFTEIHQFGMLSRNGRGVDDQRGTGIAAGLRNQIHVLFIVNQRTLFLELHGECRGCLVVASHDGTFVKEIAGNGAHADAAGSHEINGLYIFQFHFLCFLQAFGLPICYMILPA